MEDMDIASILKTLKQFFGNLVSREDKREQRTKSLDNISIPEFKGWQAPLKEWENSGNFSPGVATDKRHPKGHDGLDMRASLGSSVFPIGPGKVKNVYTDPKGGLSIVIEHPKGVSSYYAHLNSANVKINNLVDYDTIIGTCGYSGNAHPSRGGGISHVHLQTWINGSLVNPGKFFPVKPYTPFNPKTEVAILPGVKPRTEPTDYRNA